MSDRNKRRLRRAVGKGVVVFLSLVCLIVVAHLFDLEAGTFPGGFGNAAE